MAAGKNARDEQAEPLSPEKWDQLNTKLWKIFEHSSQWTNDYTHGQTAATAALAIIQLQALKPKMD